MSTTDANSVGESVSSSTSPCVSPSPSPPPCTLCGSDISDHHHHHPEDVLSPLHKAPQASPHAVLQLVTDTEDIHPSFAFATRRSDSMLHSIYHSHDTEVALAQPQRPQRTTKRASPFLSVERPSLARRKASSYSSSSSASASTSSGWWQWLCCKRCRRHPKGRSLSRHQMERFIDTPAYGLLPHQKEYLKICFVPLVLDVEREAQHNRSWWQNIRGMLLLLSALVTVLITIEKTEFVAQSPHAVTTVWLSSLGVNMINTLAVNSFTNFKYVQRAVMNLRCENSFHALFTSFLNCVNRYENFESPRDAYKSFVRDVVRLKLTLVNKQAALMHPSNNPMYQDQHQHISASTSRARHYEGPPQDWDMMVLQPIERSGDVDGDDADGRPKQDDKGVRLADTKVEEDVSCGGDEEGDLPAHEAESKSESIIAE